MLQLWKEEILTDEIMYYYLGLLNSKLINYVFYK